MRIGELAKAAGLTTQAVRFYEQIGLLPATPRSANGYRDYPARTAARIGFIRQAQSAGLSLAEIRSVLAVRDNGQPPCAHVNALIQEHLADIDHRLSELTEARHALSDLARRADATDPATCHEPDICTIFAARLSSSTPDTRPH